MLTLKAKMYERWILWRGQMAPAMEAAEPFDGAAPLDGAAPVEEADTDDYGYIVEEHAIAAMMMLNGDTNAHKPFQQQAV